MECDFFDLGNRYLKPSMIVCLQCSFSNYLLDFKLHSSHWEGGVAIMSSAYRSKRRKQKLQDTTQQGNKEFFFFTGSSNSQTFVRF